MSKYPHLTLNGENLFVTPSNDEIRRYGRNHDQINWHVQSTAIINVPEEQEPCESSRH
jgi:hypothetical protein